MALPSSLPSTLNPAVPEWARWGDLAPHTVVSQEDFMSAWKTDAEDALLLSEHLACLLRNEYPEGCTGATKRPLEVCGEIYLR